MSAYSTLELTLSEILRVVNPLRDDRLARHQIINELRVVVQSVESLRDVMGNGRACFNARQE
ncbi:hypothetical protein CsSME_00028591 [Camellia sinensis var. sinensis]